jgi:GTP-binding protein HflX
VLKEIGADHIPQLIVFNKIDLAGLEPSVALNEYGKIDRFLSARTGVGLSLLRDAIADFASVKAQQMSDEKLTSQFDDVRFNLQ